MITSARWALVILSFGSAAGAAELRHARHFTIEARDGWQLVTVHNAARASADVFTYALVPRGKALPANLPKAAAVVEIPIRRFVALSGTYLPHLPLIGRLDALVALSLPDAVSDPAVRAAIAAGKVASLGAGQGLDLERLAALRPDLVMAANSSDASREARVKLQALGIPLAVNIDFMEETPLGRAEWIKFTAVFFGPDAEAAAETVFTDIERRYQALVTLAAKATQHPTVFTNAPFGGIWHISGGRSFMAATLRDAGARYVWDDDTGTGGVAKDFEAIFARAREAEIWLNPGQMKTRAEMLSSDERFAQFRAFREKRVYNCDLRLTPAGGNEFYELAAIRPDLVLADLIWIFHPDLLPKHQPTFFRRLE